MPLIYSLCFITVSVLGFLPLCLISCPTHYGPLHLILTVLYFQGSSWCLFFSVSLVSNGFRKWAQLAVGNINCWICSLDFFFSYWVESTRLGFIPFYKSVLDNPSTQDEPLSLCQGSRHLDIYILSLPTCNQNLLFSVQSPMQRQFIGKLSLILKTGQKYCMGIFVHSFIYCYSHQNIFPFYCFFVLF